MQPGLNRAVPMGILGFLVGALLVILLRELQGLDPVWDAEVGFIMAAFVSAGFFVWGMGAFDPRMNQHAHEPELDELGMVVVHEDEHHEEEPDEPFRILGATLWQISFLTIAMIVILAAMATFPSGLRLQVTSDPDAARDQVGYTTMDLPILGEDVVVSQLTMFVGLVIVTLLSLGVIGGLLAIILTFLNQGVTVSKASPNTPLSEDDARSQTNKDRSTQGLLSLGLYVTAVAVLFFALTLVIGEPDWLPIPLAAVGGLVVVAAFRMTIPLEVFATLSVVLYYVFYFVAIGLVLQNPALVRVLLSLVNALLFAAIIVYPAVILRAVGKAAAWLLRIVRDIPSFLFQR